MAEDKQKKDDIGAETKEVVQDGLREGKADDAEKTPLGEGGSAEKVDFVDDNRDVFDLGLDTRNSFRIFRKTVRHYIAHEEYGVLFSFCGIRTTKKSVDYNPPARQTDLRCEKCKQHIWQDVAQAHYAQKMKNKKDLLE